MSDQFTENKSERCDACWNRATHIAELPRMRSAGQGKGTAPAPPAKFRLCGEHSKLLCEADPHASIRKFGGGYR